MMQKRIQFFITLFFISVYFLCKEVESREARIIGGNATESNEFKYVVFIYREDVGGHCTGGILSKDLILTVAHCVINMTTDAFVKGRIRVISGANQIYQSDKGTGILVQTVMVPQFYVGSSNFHSNGDIGLLRLAEPLSRDLERISLPTSPQLNHFENKVFKFAGFGYTEVLVDNNGIQTYKIGFDGKLLQADMKISEDCDGKRYFPPIPADAFCAKLVNHENRDPIGICKGDSGGPLVDSNKVVIGIASYGRRSCNENMKPTVFTKIYKYHVVIMKAIKGASIGRFKDANETGYF